MLISFTYEAQKIYDEVYIRAGLRKNEGDEQAHRLSDSAAQTLCP